MARIVVAYDPENRLAMPAEGDVPPGMRFALLDVADGDDLASVARKLIEMLLPKECGPCPDHPEWAKDGCPWHRGPNGERLPRG